MLRRKNKAGAKKKQVRYHGTAGLYSRCDVGGPRLHPRNSRTGVKEFFCNYIAYALLQPFFENNLNGLYFPLGYKPQPVHVR